MKAPPLDAAVEGRMQRIRCDFDQDLESAVDSVRSFLRWEYYVESYPWVCVGAAIALGFLIVPKRSTSMRLDLASLTELAGSGDRVAASAPAGTRGLVNALLTNVANTAFRAAAAYLGRRAGRLLGSNGQREESRHDP